MCMYMYSLSIMSLLFDVILFLAEGEQRSDHASGQTHRQSHRELIISHALSHCLVVESVYMCVLSSIASTSCLP